jgi:hypothetical protein
LVEELQEDLRMLEQESREYERTWNTLTTVRANCAVFLRDLGEILIWGVLGEDLRHELLHWLRNYLAEWTGRQFIASNGGGVQFHEDVLAAGREKGYWRSG